MSSRLATVPIPLQTLDIWRNFAGKFHQRELKLSHVASRVVDGRKTPFGVKNSYKKIKEALCICVFQRILGVAILKDITRSGQSHLRKEKFVGRLEHVRNLVRDISSIKCSIKEGVRSEEY